MILSWQQLSSVNIPYSCAYTSGLDGTARSGKDYFPHVPGHISCCGKIDVHMKLNKTGLKCQIGIWKEWNSKSLLFCVCMCKWFINCPPTDHICFVIQDDYRTLTLGLFGVFILPWWLMLNFFIIFLKMWLIFYKPSILLILHCSHSFWCL